MLQQKTACTAAGDVTARMLHATRTHPRTRHAPAPANTSRDAQNAHTSVCSALLPPRAAGVGHIVSPTNSRHSSCQLCQSMHGCEGPRACMAQEASVSGCQASRIERCCGLTQMSHASAADVPWPDAAPAVKPGLLRSLLHYPTQEVVMCRAAQVYLSRSCATTTLFTAQPTGVVGHSLRTPHPASSAS